MSATSDALATLFEFEPRPATNDDVGYVLDSMRRTLQPEYVGVSDATMREACAAFLGEWMNRGATLTVAPAVPGGFMLWGWALTIDRTPLFVYVRRSHRRARIATRLLGHVGIDPRDGIQTRFLTYDLRHMMVKSSWRIEYWPVL